jgi:hypothetical protein
LTFKLLLLVLGSRWIKSISDVTTDGSSWYLKYMQISRIVNKTLPDKKLINRKAEPLQPEIRPFKLHQELLLMLSKCQD